MMEIKIGEIATLPDGRKVQAVEDKGMLGCNACVFRRTLHCYGYSCKCCERSDHKSVYYIPAPIVTKDNIHIEDSYKVSKRDMSPYLDKLQADHPESEVWQRTHTSLIHEWCVHNLCYNLHLWRSHTKDVDLDKDANGMEWRYNVLGFFAWFLVK